LLPDTDMTENRTSGELMPRVPLVSSTLTWVAYSPGHGLLEVEFRSGEIYRYFDVPQQTYDQVLHAESKGAYLNLNIRKSFSFQTDDSDVQHRLLKLKWYWAEAPIRHLQGFQIRDQIGLFLV
jgi:hypothetical protein